MALLQVICFSMDRVFQLAEYLRTLQRHARLRGAAWDAQPHFARAAVICRCSSPAIRARYEELERAHASRGVRFLYESDTQSFADCLLLSLANGGGDESSTRKPRYVLFNVDDAFYFDDVDLADAFAFLDGGASAQTPSRRPFAFHVKLAPNIWRSHLANKPMLPLPPMQTVVRRSEAPAIGTSTTASSAPAMPFEMAFHVFDPARGTLDWNYPWDLSGSVYLRSTVEEIVTEILAEFGTKGINHPNHLELRGHQVLQRWKEGHAIDSLQCACPLSPKMHVFAINQVQDVFNNRLYEEVQEGKSQAGDITNLLRLYEAGETIDETFYRRNRFASVHIGTLVLKTRDSTRAAVQSGKAAQAENFSSPLVSVVIPVFNVAEYIEQALRSVMSQTYQHLEIIVVDDASTDTTSEIITRLQEQDPRIRLLQSSTNLGVAASLNKGFAAAKGEFVARMDGDDVSVPSRIERQINYLRENPQVAIVGASMLILRERESPGSRELGGFAQHETAVYPTSPLVTRWRMLFGCFVGHPTVVMRREVLDTLAGERSCEYYSSSQSSSEDYELWLRCLHTHNLTIQSMGDVLVIHRKHLSNASKVHRERQAAETRATATRYIQSIAVGSNSDANSSSIGISITQVQPLFDANLGESVDALKGSIEVLRMLQAEICSRSGGASKAEEDERECEHAYINQDAASREGELALKSMLLDPISGSQMWATFASRHPEVSRSAFEKLFKKK